MSGGAFLPLGGGENRLRLSCSMPNVDEIREGIRRLAMLLQRGFPGVLDENPSPLATAKLGSMASTTKVALLSSVQT